MTWFEEYSLFHIRIMTSTSRMKKLAGVPGGLYMWLLLRKWSTTLWRDLITWFNMVCSIDCSMSSRRRIWFTLACFDNMRILLFWLKALCWKVQWVLLIVSSSSRAFLKLEEDQVVVQVEASTYYYYYGVNRIKSWWSFTSQSHQGKNWLILHCQGGGRKRVIGSYFTRGITYDV